MPVFVDIRQFFYVEERYLQGMEKEGVGGILDGTYMLMGVK